MPELWSTNHRPALWELTRVRFLPQNVAPSPVSLCLYAYFPTFPHINPGVQTIAFFSKFVFSLTLPNMSTQSGSLYVIYP